MSRLTFGYFKLLWKKILLSLLSLLSLSIISVSTSRASDLGESVEKLKNHVSGGVIILFRNELWSTFTQQGVPTNRTYDFLFVRGRGFIDFTWDKFTLHFMGQGVQAFNLPRNAAFGLGPLFVSLPGENDGVVTVEETRIEGLRDHLVLPVSHTGMLMSEPVAAQTATFLESGGFRR